MSFANYYKWLKYTILTPSFFFKNRFFIDKQVRNNLIYSNPELTQKSFTWSRLNSNILNNFWFSIMFRYLLYSVVALTLLLVYFHGYNFLTATNPFYLFMKPAIYCFWRIFDIFYFIILQLQYLIITTSVSTIFFIINIIAPTNYSLVKWMRKYHAEAPVKKEESIFAFLEKLEDKLFIQELKNRTNLSLYDKYVNRSSRKFNIFSLMNGTPTELTQRESDIIRFLKTFYDFNYTCSAYSLKQLSSVFYYPKTYNSFDILILSPELFTYKHPLYDYASPCF